MNGKSDVDLEKEVQKNENKRLAMWAQGRWGGVMFVPGGTLVQGDGYKKAEGEQPQHLNLNKASAKQSDGTELTDRAHHMAEKKRRKEERRRKSEAELGGKAASIESIALEPKVGMAEVTENVHGVNSGKKKAGSKKKNKKRERSTLCPDNDNSVATPGEQVESDPVAPEPPTTSRTIPALPRTGRHVIRGKNIEAKKMAFSDVKMLDQVRYSLTSLLSILTKPPDIHGKGLKYTFQNPKPWKAQEGRPSASPNVG